MTDPDPTSMPDGAPEERGVPSLPAEETADPAEGIGGPAEETPGTGEIAGLPESQGPVDELSDPADAVADTSQGVPGPLGASAQPDISDAETPPLAALLEAVLLVTDEPVPAVTLAQVVERPTEEVESALAALASDYVAQGRGFELRTAAGGWRLYTRADCAPWVERFVLDGQQARLTQAALETLAVIAYRQPVTRARVSAVRGVNVDGVVRTLVARGLVSDAGQDPETGGTLYTTTGLLLEKLGLDSLEELPSLAPLLPEIDDMEEGSTST